ncbi:MAG: RlmE family RNA methyltransferase [DPANN group archaeon]|nr:RlmE family RNA methyltransferase [DPANN group archaeon]
MQWHVKRKNEFYYKKAKELGYRSRSAFKLLEIQEKFRIIKRGDRVLDLGAAPGGWSQVAANIVGDNGMIIGVDVQPAPNIGKNFRFILADVTKENSEGKIAKACTTFDVVLSDMSPQTTGIKDIDVGVSNVLAFKSLHLTKIFLKAGGNFACKIFQGKYFVAFLSEAKEYFEKIHSFKPKSSDKASREVYIVCLGLKEHVQKDSE